MYRGYDRAALDAQYNLRARHPEFQQHFDAWAEHSARTRAQLPCRLDVAYGTAPGETLDLFLPVQPGSPVVMFIHGGYWQFLDKSDFSFVAAPLVAEGFAVVAVNYDLAPLVDMDEIVRQNRAALAWVWQNAPAFDGDPDSIFLSGHSAGGHLTAMLMATRWPEFGGIPQDVIKGACAVSGLYDLEPIRLCYLNEALGLDAASVRRNSPLRLAYPGAAPLVVAVGAGESEEFLRHSAEFAALWRSQGQACEHLVLPERNHFTVMDELRTPAGALSKALCRLVAGKVAPA